MGKRRAYRSTSVKKVVLEKVLESAPAGDVHVGMDIGKGEIFTVVRWANETFERPWKAENPTEVMPLVALLQVLAKDRGVTIAMESTGTYGDALRQALGDAGLRVHRVSGKAAHDYARYSTGFLRSTTVKMRRSSPNWRRWASHGLGRSRQRRTRTGRWRIGSIGSTLSRAPRCFG